MVATETAIEITTRTGQTVKLGFPIRLGEPNDFQIKQIRAAGKNPADYRSVSGVVMPAADAEWAQGISDARKAAKATALEAAIPGLAEAIRLEAAAYNESERYSQQFAAMMEDESNDGARPPKAEDKSFATRLRAHLATHPRAALYLKAKAQHEGASWADNAGKGAAGERAMEILKSGGAIEAAEAALATRREVID